MNLVPFSFKGTPVRVITDENGEPWFVGKDVCSLLGYADTTNAMKQHCRGVVKYHPILDTLGRTQETRILSEGDTLRLIVNSTMPAAQEFESWVFDEVLPTIRRTGSYQRPLTPAEQALAHAQVMVDLERRQSQQQVALERVERQVADLSQTMVWDHCPQNCQSLTRIKETMLKRHGLSGAVVDYVLKVWPNQPNPAGMVRNGHEEALGSQYLVWSKSHVTAAFHRFVSESTMVTATQATHPYFEGRFRLVQKVPQ
ncbi:BRO-N domain-containing protein [Pseudomonas juntendi]|uniref:BRO-N domain-containing protein n=1 Tax=Pseudomonas juntendi TaxID=2666183 RepID=UPI00244B6CAB|nr:Bro-N domain-containing protein [Pseudomonas juntendi]MDG9890182.1 Bro-N domain-containing protein [Pseudomonas juntendi]